MIRTGCCLPGGSFMPQGEKATPENIHEVILKGTEKALEAGFDYTEIGASFLDSLTEEGLSVLRKKAEKGTLGVEIANSFIPACFSLFDENKKEELEKYVDKILYRASLLNIETLVFGSGQARNIPEGTDREKGREVIKNFLRMCNAYGEKYKVTVAAEPLNSSECNVLNTVKECSDTVRELNLPYIKLISDAFHMWYEKEPLRELSEAKENIVHIHISEPPERIYPGAKGGEYLKEYAKKLKEIKYEGRVSMECKYYDFYSELKPAFIFMKENFYEA